MQIFALTLFNARPAKCAYAQAQKHPVLRLEDKHISRNPSSSLHLPQQQVAAVAGEPFEAGFRHGGDLVDDHALALRVGVGGDVPVAKHGVERTRRAKREVVVDSVNAVALPVLAFLVERVVHDVKNGNCLEQLHLGGSLSRNNQTTSTGGFGRCDGSADVASNKFGRHGFQGGE